MNVSMSVLKQRSLPSRERHRRHHHQLGESLSPPYRDVRSQRAACKLSTQINVLYKYLRISAAPRRKFSVKNENHARGGFVGRSGLRPTFDEASEAAFSASGSNKWPPQQQQKHRIFIQFSSKTLVEWLGIIVCNYVQFSSAGTSSRIALHFIQSLHRISSSYADKLYASSPALTPDQLGADFRARQS